MKKKLQLKKHKITNLQQSTILGGATNFAVTCGDCYSYNCPNNPKPIGTQNITCNYMCTTPASQCGLPGQCGIHNLP